MDKAVVLLSGGLDSAVAAYSAKRAMGSQGDLFPLNISYGQVHEKEKDCAIRLASSLGCDLKWLQVPIGSLVESSLTGTGRIPTEEAQGIPSTWVPQRNSIFLALAYAYAETVGADWIFTGINAVDYSGYPDCRPDFIKSIQWALNLASKRFVEEGLKIRIVCPLMDLSKSKIIQLGISMEVPFGSTWSCYRGRDQACGVCPSCIIRLKGFKEVGLKDPIKYEIDDEGEVNG